MTAPPYTHDDLIRARKDYSRASVDEQSNNLLLFVADGMIDPGNPASFKAPEGQSVVRANSVEISYFFCANCKTSGCCHGVRFLVTPTQTDGKFLRSAQPSKVGIALPSCERRMSCRRQRSWRCNSVTRNSTAYLNFTSGPRRLPKQVTAWLGFDDRLEAGLIDNRMRVEIRNSRFVIADLTHDNRGAYWEAGYGEGLGKPVIYLCKAEVFRAKSTHFDTSHHLTIQWDPAALNRFAEDLKAKY